MTGAAVAVLGTPVLLERPGIALRFPDAALCDFAADMLPAIPAFTSGVGGRSETLEGPRYSVSVSPGSITLRGADLVRIDRRIVAAQDVHAQASTAGLTWSCGCRQRYGPASPFEYRRPEYGDWVPCNHAEVAPAFEGEAAGVRVWSRKSRARMVHRVSQADWAPLWGQGLPVMVTLTYPGEWEVFAPCARVVKAHLRSWVKRFARAYGYRPVMLWKLEFQRRGAPHFHILLALPSQTAAVPAGPRRKARPAEVVTLATFRAWAAKSWSAVICRRRADIVADLVEGAYTPVPWAPGGMSPELASALFDEERQRGLDAGVAVDMREGTRMRDPKRVAVYFLKHSAPGDGSGSKEYQHRVPDLWMQSGGAGRFWGFEGVDMVAPTRYVAVGDFIALRRTLRRWSTSRARPAVMSRGRVQGGWVLVNDGPAMASQLARALSLRARPSAAAEAVAWSISVGMHPSIARDRVGLRLFPAGAPFLP